MHPIRKPTVGADPRELHRRGKCFGAKAKREMRWARPQAVGYNPQKDITMPRKLCSVIVLAMTIAPVTATPVFAQSQGKPAAASDCPAGTRYIPPGRDGAGTPVEAYCAAAPAQGTNDPYTGRNVADPQFSPSGGPGQFVPQTR